MKLGLQGKRALVLGSSSGMGKAIAAGLRAEQADVVVAGRNPERVARVAGEIGAAAGIAADLTEPGAAHHVVDGAVDALGGLDIFVGNTGGGAPGGLTEGGFDAVEAGFRAMLQPQLEAAQRAIPALRAGGDGRMVFLTARSVLEASPDLALSSVFRSGVAAAARSLALELAPEVTVNVVVPGRFDTPALQRFEVARAAQTGRSTAEVREGHEASIPLRRLGRAEELADLVVSERARYITGATFRIDGGLTRGF
jgi:3-oxoacyl-[acyl-carrier protein] reductase